ncbi:uncharacterized protein RCC_09167 [Ramularia collo-cygni]|uniref:Uncharacterized protein n=1 Tax=Ramularia collo-cygni TaxID=112498 RepID=A0A2D3V658_9PEZI|nr:uncharacterized protein RCC_09167 [Ramularia collo-cygni]CZT23453.1 uncharacterized protein RCC_09167 [Ramularia collo-cygni]
MAATITTSDNVLDARIQDLAQELQDQIFKMAFLEIPDTVAIVPDHRAPAALQLNRAIRAKFAEEYYRKVVFVGQFTNATPILLPAWLSQLSEEHQNAIRSIRIAVSDVAGFTVSSLGRWIYDSLEDVRNGAEIPRGTLDIRKASFANLYIAAKLVNTCGGITWAAEGSHDSFKIRRTAHVL